MQQDTQQILDDWSNTPPMPVGTVWTDLEIYCDGDRVLDFSDNELNLVEVAKGTNDIVIFGNGEPVWVKADNVIQLDRTTLAPLAMEVA